MTRRSIISWMGIPWTIDSRSPKDPEFVNSDQWVKAINAHSEALLTEASGGFRFRATNQRKDWEEPLHGPTIPWIRERFRMKLAYDPTVSLDEWEVRDWITGRVIPQEAWDPRRKG